MLAIVNNTEINTGVHISFWISGLDFFTYLPKVKLLGHKRVQFFNCLRKIHTVFYGGCTNLHSHQHYTRVPFSPPLRQHLLFVDLLMTPVLTDVKWYIVVVLIYISLMITEVEHLFISYWPSVCSLRRSVCSGTLPIFNWIVCAFGVKIYESFRCLDINPLSYISLVNIFSHSFWSGG